jgi:ribonucleoside-diphosphate reductase alpha chain
MDHPVLNKVSDEARNWVTQLRECAIESNKTWADILGINRSTSITCVKPSGSVSQLVDSASGLHARYSPYYIRTVRADVLDPLSLFLISKGFPFELGATNKNQYVFSFPIKSPDGSVVEGSRTALEALEHWKMLQDDYCEHKPSMTCHYKEEEFLGVGNWLYQNFDSVSGISFLPLDNHAYVQAPYQAVTKEQYDELVKTMPAGIDWTEMSAFEREDNTVASQTLACSGGGGSCEIDLAK